jgi:hypothetical protein
MLDEDKSAE